MNEWKNQLITKNKPVNESQLDEVIVNATPTDLEPTPEVESVKCIFISSSNVSINSDKSPIRAKYSV